MAKYRKLYASVITSETEKQRQLASPAKRDPGRVRGMVLTEIPQGHAEKGPHLSHHEVPVVHHAGGDDDSITVVAGLAVVLAREFTQPGLPKREAYLPGATCAGKLTWVWHSGNFKQLILAHVMLGRADLKTY